MKIQYPKMEDEDCCWGIKPWCYTKDFQPVFNFSINQPSLPTKENLHRSIMSMLKPGHVFAAETMSVDAPVRVDNVDHHVRVRSELIIPTHTVITSRPQTRQRPRPNTRDTACNNNNRPCRDSATKINNIEEEDDEEDDDDDDDEDDDGDEDVENEDDYNVEDDGFENEDDYNVEEDIASAIADEECENEDKEGCEMEETPDIEDEEVEDEEFSEAVDKCQTHHRTCPMPCRDVFQDRSQKCLTNTKNVIEEDVDEDEECAEEEEEEEVCDEKEDDAVEAVPEVKKGSNKSDEELNELHDECLYIAKEELKAICKKYRRYDRKWRIKRPKTCTSDNICATEQGKKTDTEGENKKTSRTAENEKEVEECDDELEEDDENKDEIVQQNEEEDAQERECLDPCKEGEEDDDDEEESYEEEEEKDPYYGDSRPPKPTPCIIEVEKGKKAEPDDLPRDYSRYDKSTSKGQDELSSKSTGYFLDGSGPCNNTKREDEQKKMKLPPNESKNCQSCPNGRKEEPMYYDDQIKKKVKQKKRSKKREHKDMAQSCPIKIMEEPEYFDCKANNVIEVVQECESKVKSGKTAPKDCSPEYYSADFSNNNNNDNIGEENDAKCDNKDEIKDSNEDDGASDYAFETESDDSDELCFEERDMAEEKDSYSYGLMYETCPNTSDAAAEYAEDKFKERSDRFEKVAETDLSDLSATQSTVFENQAKYLAYGHSSRDDNDDNYFTPVVSSSPEKFATATSPTSLPEDYAFSGPCVREPTVTEEKPHVTERETTVTELEVIRENYPDEQTSEPFAIHSFVVPALKVDPIPLGLKITTLTSNHYEQCKRIFESMKQRAFGDDFEDYFENGEADDQQENPRRSLSKMNTTTLEDKDLSLLSGSETAINEGTESSSASNSFLSSLFNMISKSGTMINRGLSRSEPESGKSSSENEEKYFSFGRYREKVVKRTVEGVGCIVVKKSKSKNEPTSGKANFRFGKTLNDEVKKKLDTEDLIENVSYMTKPTSPNMWKLGKVEVKKKEHNFRFGQLVCDDSPATSAHKHFGYKPPGKSEEPFCGGFSFKSYQSKKVKEVINQSHTPMYRQLQTSPRKPRLFGTVRETSYAENIESEEKELNNTSTGVMCKEFESSSARSEGRQLLDSIRTIVNSQEGPFMEPMAEVCDVAECVGNGATTGTGNKAPPSFLQPEDMGMLSPAPAELEQSSLILSSDVEKILISSGVKHYDLLQQMTPNRSPTSVACEKKMKGTDKKTTQFLKAGKKNESRTPDARSGTVSHRKVKEVQQHSRKDRRERSGTKEEPASKKKTFASNSARNVNDNKRLRKMRSVESLTNTRPFAVVSSGSIAGEVNKSGNNQPGVEVYYSPASAGLMFNQDIVLDDIGDTRQKKTRDPPASTGVSSSAERNLTCEVGVAGSDKKRNPFYKTRKPRILTGVSSCFKSKKSTADSGCISASRRRQQSFNVNKTRNGFMKKPCTHSNAPCVGRTSMFRKWRLVKTMSNVFREENQNVNCGEEDGTASKLGNVDSIICVEDGAPNSETLVRTDVDKNPGDCVQEEATSELALGAFLSGAIKEPMIVPKLVNYTEHRLVCSVKDYTKQLNESLTLKPALTIRNHGEEMSKNVLSKVEISVNETPKVDTVLDASSKEGENIEHHLESAGTVHQKERGHTLDNGCVQEKKTGVKSYLHSGHRQLMQQFNENDARNSLDKCDRANDYKLLLVSNYLHNSTDECVEVQPDKGDQGIWQYPINEDSQIYTASYPGSTWRDGRNENFNASDNEDDENDKKVFAQNQHVMYSGIHMGGQEETTKDRNPDSDMFFGSNYDKYENYNFSRSDEAESMVDSSYVESFIDKRNRMRMSTDQQLDAPGKCSEGLPDETAEENCWTIKSFSPVVTSWNFPNEKQDRCTSYWRGSGGCGDTVCKGSRTESFPVKEKHAELTNKVDSAQPVSEWYTKSREVSKTTSGPTAAQSYAAKGASAGKESLAGEGDNHGHDVALARVDTQENAQKQDSQAPPWDSPHIDNYHGQAQSTKFDFFNYRVQNENDLSKDNAYETESVDNEWYTSNCDVDKCATEDILEPTILAEGPKTGSGNVTNQGDNEDKQSDLSRVDNMENIKLDLKEDAWRSQRLSVDTDQSMSTRKDMTEFASYREQCEDESMNGDQREKVKNVNPLYLAQCSFKGTSGDISLGPNQGGEGDVKGTHSDGKDTKREQGYIKHQAASRIKSQNASKSKGQAELTDLSEIVKTPVHDLFEEEQPARQHYRHSKSRTAETATGKLPPFALRGKVPETPVKKEMNIDKEEKTKANDVTKETKASDKAQKSKKDSKVEQNKKEKPARVFKIDYEEATSGKDRSKVKARNNKQKISSVEAQRHTTTGPHRPTTIEAQRSTTFGTQRPTKIEILGNAYIIQQAAATHGVNREADLKNNSENNRKSKPAPLFKIDYEDTKDRKKAVRINNSSSKQKSRASEAKKSEQQNISEVLQVSQQTSANSEETKDGGFKTGTEYNTGNQKNQKPARMFKTEFDENLSGKDRAKPKVNNNNYKPKMNEMDGRRPDQLELAGGQADSSKLAASPAANTEKDKSKVTLEIQRHKQRLQKSEVKLSEDTKEKVENSKSEICSQQQKTETSHPSSTDKSKQVKYPVLFREDRKRWKTEIRRKVTKPDSEKSSNTGKVKTSDSTNHQFKENDAQTKTVNHSLEGRGKSSSAETNVDLKSKHQREVSRFDSSKGNLLPSMLAETKAEDVNRKMASKTDVVRGTSYVTESKTTPDLTAKPRQYINQTDRGTSNFLDSSLVDTVARAWMTDSGSVDVSTTGTKRSLSPAALLRETSASQSVSCSYIHGPTVISPSRKPAGKISGQNRQSYFSSRHPAPGFRSPKYHDDNSGDSRRSSHMSCSERQCPQSYFEIRQRNHESVANHAVYDNEEPYNVMSEKKRENSMDYPKDARPFYHVLDRYPPDASRTGPRSYYNYNEGYETSEGKRNVSRENSFSMQGHYYFDKSSENNPRKCDKQRQNPPTQPKQFYSLEPSNNYQRTHDNFPQMKNKQDVPRKLHQQERNVVNPKEKPAASSHTTHPGNNESKGLFSYKISSQGNRSEIMQARPRVSQPEVSLNTDTVTSRTEKARTLPSKATLVEPSKEKAPVVKAEVLNKEPPKEPPPQGLLARLFNTLTGGSSKSKAPTPPEKEQDDGSKEQKENTSGAPESTSASADNEKNVSKTKNRSGRASSPTLSVSNAKKLRPDYKKNINWNADSHMWSLGPKKDIIRLNTNGANEENKWLHSLPQLVQQSETEKAARFTPKHIVLPLKKTDLPEMPSPFVEITQKQHCYEKVQCSVDKEKSPKKNYVDLLSAVATWNAVVFIVLVTLYLAACHSGILKCSLPCQQHFVSKSFYGFLYLAIDVFVINKFLPKEKWTFHSLWLLGNKADVTRLWFGWLYLPMKLATTASLHTAYFFWYIFEPLRTLLCSTVCITTIRYFLQLICCGHLTALTGSKDALHTKPFLSIGKSDPVPQCPNHK